NSDHKFFRYCSVHRLESLVEVFSKRDFSQIYDSYNVDYCFRSFIDVIVTSIGESCPLKPYISTVRNKSWITYGIIAACQQLKQIHWPNKNMQSYESQENYRLSKVKYRELLRETNLGNNEKLHTSTNVNKTVWNIVNEVTGRGYKSVKEITLIMDAESISHPE
ncbi:hypothetical protein WA026_012334, partial [Henosepilachna vigintioctopunctata]